MSETALQWIRDGLTVLFGALAGGVTNRVAIMMLFHPYEPPRLFGREVRWLQGAVPKNQGRLAATIGRTIGTRLLTPEDVAAELQDERLREAFDDQLRKLIVDLLEGEKPALGELIPETALPEVRDTLHAIAETLCERAIDTLDSDEFGEDAERILATLAESLESESLADSVSPEVVADLRARAEAWLDTVAASDSFTDTVRQHLTRAAERLLQPGRSFEQLLPVGLVGAVEHAISDYLPVAIERVGRFLEDPAARAGVERSIHDLLERFMRDLRFHQRVVAKLIITEETVSKVIDTLEAEGADRLGELLREPEAQSAIARSVNEGIVEFLRRPVVQVLGEPGDPQVETALDAIAGWVVQATGDDHVRAFLLDRAETAVFKAGKRSWADLVRLVPAQRAGGWVAGGLRSERGTVLVARFQEWLVERALTQPLGTVNGLAREGTADRLTEALSVPVWAWIAAKIPEVTANVRVAERVETKILEFPLSDLEQLIRSVTHQELNLIVRLGYLLGAFIGLTLVGIRWLLPL
ncbi:MAG: DUF445 family protein [Gemmatimonadota bacterium]